MRKPVNVPVVMYHSIADADDHWPWRRLSCPVATFGGHLKALRWAGFHTISPQMLYDHMSTGAAIPSRSVVLTFDDGYLDNWVYAYPLLKQYGFCSTIFVNPEFVDPVEFVRPNLEDVWSSRVAEDDLPRSGFLSWAEMRRMETTGTVDIQSHGMSHTWHFSSSEIIDFHHPGDPYPWLAWNACPERKHLWMSEDQQSFVAWGAPVYEHEKALATRRYYPDEELNAALADYVRRNGNASFFGAPDWRRRLQQVAMDHRQARGVNGRFESDDEYQTRIRHELAESKHIIEGQLRKTVNFLCWPGGGYNDTSVGISEQVGYLASTLSSRHRGKKNTYGQDPSRWGRTSPPMFMRNPTDITYNGGLHLVLLLNAARGSSLSAALHRLLKIPFKCSQWLERHQRNGDR